MSRVPAIAPRNERSGGTGVPPARILSYSSGTGVPPVRVLAACLAALIALAGCARTPPRPAASPAIVSTKTDIDAWEFDGTPGIVLRTAHHRLFTTEADPQLLEQLPTFLEAVVDHYVTALGPLPRPALRLDTFLLRDRTQWERLTRQVMGDEAHVYLRIQRGGFSSGGRAILWTIGRRDTLAILAHEGWHQYAQRTFRDALPGWADEGVATYMEGFVPTVAGAAPIMAPWANPERFDQLRSAFESGSLIPLQRLITVAPRELIAAGGNEALTYYGQVWALIHFLREGGNGMAGEHRQQLMNLVADTAAGRMRRYVEARAARRIPAATPTDRLGAEVFRAYFGPDLAAADREFRVFVASIATDAGRAAILMGRSPLDQSAAGLVGSAALVSSTGEGRTPK
ncbi:MAG: hypothetical protein ACKVW3_05100 [Phycisphaerales bacterium]